MRALLGCLLLATSLRAQFPDGTPVASRITVGTPDANYLTSVTGAAGTVGAEADVMLITLETGHYAITRAAADGSFSTAIFAPRGTSIMVKADPERKHIVQLARSPQPLIPFHTSELTSLHGTIVRVAVPSAASGIAFANAGIAPNLSLAPWMTEGTLNKQQFAAGETIEARFTLTLLASTFATATNPRVQCGLTIQLLSDANARPATAFSTFDSAVMTPTGLPIERFPAFGPPYGQYVPFTVQGPKGTAQMVTTFTIPADFRAGWYVSRLGCVTQGIPTPTLDTNEKRTTFVSFMRGQNHLPPIRIGSPAPARLPAVILMNELVEGHRGAVSIEDRGRYAPTNHITTHSDVTIVPRLDATGAPRRYNLEPFVMTMGADDRGGPPNAPLVPFRFPSGSLNVSVRAPSGTMRTLGPAQFKQWHLVGVANREGHILEGGPHITDPFELRTFDPAFDVVFAEDGLHTIAVDGTVEDLWGNAWRLGGTYEVHVAQPLVIDSATLPMTPFETGDRLAPVVELIPPVAADVEIRVRIGARSERFAGKANRFGHFAPASRFLFTEPGEYRVDVVATHRASDGSLWMGTRTWGGVVARRDGPIRARGRRGHDAQPPPERQQWFQRPQGTVDGHIHFPFHGGDVSWLQENDSAIPVLTFQDLTGTTSPTVASLYAAAFGGGSRVLDPAVAIGEIPLFSANASGMDPHLAPDRADAWGYAYMSVQRPLVRVREVIAENNVLAYWRFNDRYALQTGSGEDGDLPNDFKFQFGGAVLRGPLFDPPRYAIYASLFVLVPNDDPGGGTRVFPPFQGNAGPSGGPLFRLKGKDIDLFFHPTALRAGTILQLGDTASFAGYSAPTLASKIAVTVTSPSGLARTIEGQASSIGWFYDPAQDFRVVEPGVWKAKVRITYDGQISAGPLQPPYPAGDVLGSREGEFSFYVVAPDAAPLQVVPTPPESTFVAVPPPGLTNVQLSYTVAMPGFILEEGTLFSMTYRFDGERFRNDFPNLDRPRPGALTVDPVTISFLLSGTDATGARKHFARRMVILPQGVVIPEQPAAPPVPPRRRGARQGT